MTRTAPAPSRGPRRERPPCRRGWGTTDAKETAAKCQERLASIDGAKSDISPLCGLILLDTDLRKKRAGPDPCPHL